MIHSNVVPPYMSEDKDFTKRLKTKMENCSLLVLLYAVSLEIPFLYRHPLRIGITFFCGRIFNLKKMLIPAWNFQRNQSRSKNDLSLKVNDLS